jgi:uncharacterized protein (DUF736 family)|tara:strand:- start:1872 stop:2153 length:282 start_codon:yes stop_codon:yes gene_type:complete
MKLYLNSGAIFKNTIKNKAKSPDYNGDFTVKMDDIKVENTHDNDGNEVQVAKLKFSGWKKTTKKGQTFISLSLNTYEPNNEKPQKIEEDDPFE